MASQVYSVLGSTWNQLHSWATVAARVWAGAAAKTARRRTSNAASYASKQAAFQNATHAKVAVAALSARTTADATSLRALGY